jgi:hypothetical protein
MNKPLADPKARRSIKAAACFHLRVGQAGHAAKVYDEYTLPLFPLMLIMDAEGLLASGAKLLVLRPTKRDVHLQPKD